MRNTLGNKCLGTFFPLDIWLQSFVYLSVVLALGYFAVSAGVLAGLYKTQVYVKVCVFILSAPLICKMMKLGFI